MEIINNMGLKGRIRLVCHDKDGNFKYDTGFINNTITNTGKAQIALLAGDSSAVPFTYLALGTSNTAPSAGQTALIGEISTNGLQRASATVSRVTTTTTNDTLQLTNSFTASGSSTVEEVGIFNANSSGTMLGRALTGSKALVNGDQLVVTYQVIFA